MLTLINNYYRQLSRLCFLHGINQFKASYNFCRKNIHGFFVLQAKVSIFEA